LFGRRDIGTEGLKIQDAGRKVENRCVGFEPAQLSARIPQPFQAASFSQRVEGLLEAGEINAPNGKFTAKFPVSSFQF